MNKQEAWYTKEGTLKIFYKGKQVLGWNKKGKFVLGKYVISG